jgi:RimJ/RimL family protein N-acetyltransferase
MGSQTKQILKKLANVEMLQAHEVLDQDRTMVESPPMFQPIKTDRLLLRRVRSSDVGALIARRNEQAVAALQAWELPYTEEQATSLIEDTMATVDPPIDDWWMVTIADAEDNTIVGDLVLHLTWGGRSAEIGYTLAAEHWGKGFATEAASAFVKWLYEGLGVTRVHGLLHPDNVASARVLERIGMKFEGHTRLSFWLADEVSDDFIYGMTVDDWHGWNERPTEAPSKVRLIEITTDNYEEIGRLETHHSQRRFVATMAQSYADALFPQVFEGGPVLPWMRGIQADGVLVGFVMLALVTEFHDEPYLWRLLVDRLHQGRGIGKRVLDEVVAQVTSTGSNSLVTSWVEGRGSPRPFYESYGFVPTGRIIEGEVEARLVW